MTASLAVSPARAGHVDGRRRAYRDVGVTLSPRLKVKSGRVGDDRRDGDGRCAGNGDKNGNETASPPNLLNPGDRVDTALIGINGRRDDSNGTKSSNSAGSNCHTTQGHPQATPPANRARDKQSLFSASSTITARYSAVSASPGLSDYHVHCPKYPSYPKLRDPTPYTPLTKTPRASRFTTSIPTNTGSPKRIFPKRRSMKESFGEEIGDGRTQKLIGERGVGKGKEGRKEGGEDAGSEDNTINETLKELSPNVEIHRKGKRKAMARSMLTSDIVEDTVGSFDTEEKEGEEFADACEQGAGSSHGKDWTEEMDFWTR